MTDEPRRRRHDPDRRQRIIDAAVEVIAQHGVTGTTHRKIAAEAGVPLGSLTYHFDDLDAVLRAAFEQVAEVGSRASLARLAQASTRDEAITATVDVIAGNLWSTSQTLLLSYELYAYAVRHPAMEAVMRDWMDQTRTALGRHFDPLTARAIDALIEGIGIHNSVDAEPLDREQIEQILRRVAMPPE
ncbi:transcriptional regulator, TetR family [Sphingomonas gellani]|uniref:Transcriptional regulator, TetR family n=1 Tax=Sphingomonas gellani TaxID=1166340 RepID=A0A1H8J636_9SPHN|nr:TetR family transcriptional regulator [Sphingomonas gellani]SEN75756.1 transcriptional regulator, TetR family [Sphingomonas gellani]